MVKELKAAGFSDQQAEAVTRLVRQSHNVDLSHLVIKADLKSELSETKAEIIKWMFGTIGFQTLIVLGAVIALTRPLQP